MKRITLLVAMFVLAAGAAFAHGKEQHVMGKVTAMTDSSITVQTKAKGPRKNNFTFLMGPTCSSRLAKSCDR